MPTEYGVRPYTNTKDQYGKEVPYVDTIKAPTWAYALSQEVQKFSEFMKPYMTDGDYPDMENNYPRYSFDTPNNWDDVIPNNFNPNNMWPCSVTCWPPMYCDDNVVCHPSISCRPPRTGDTERNKMFSWKVLWKHEGKGKWVPYREWEYYGDIVVEGNVLTAEVKNVNKEPFNALVNTRIKEAPFGANINPLQISPPTGGWSKWPDVPMDKMRVEMTDPCGSICYTEIDVFCRVLDCCLAPTYVVMTFDNDSTPDTIARSASITCYVLNGCPPYVWSVTGTGFTFTDSSTAGPSNQLNASASACGAGTCTVTDKCGTTVFFTILCTTGHWHFQANCSASDPGGNHCWPSTCPQTPNPTLVYLDKQFWSMQRMDTCYIDGSSGTWGSCDAPLPPCGGPGACSGATCTCQAKSSSCYMVGFSYFIWNCA